MRRHRLRGDDVSLLDHDFSVRYVAENNATTTPPLISAISLWAALEGSILFWTLLATGWASLVVWWNRDRHPALMPWVGATLASVNAFFFAVMTWPGNPVRPHRHRSRLRASVRTPPAEPPVHGAPPATPLPGLHRACRALRVRRGGAGHRSPRRGVAADRAALDPHPWTFLSLGIVAGAWWSYEVLGWGGYWAWDPVENAALLPWLTATAFIHSSMVAERRSGLQVWTGALVIATFVLTLVGTFLTRSGILASVHSFTESGIGPWFLAAILVALGIALSLLVWRLPCWRAAAGSVRAAPLSRRHSCFNNVCSLAATLTVLLGTLCRSSQARRCAALSVGRLWFDRVDRPDHAALLFLMGIGPELPWGAARRAPRSKSVLSPDRRRGPVGAVAVATDCAMRSPW